MIAADQDDLEASGGLSLLFAPNERPTAAALSRVLALDMATDHSKPGHNADPAEGILHVPASGLSFEIFGLTPSSPAQPPAMEHQFGVEFAPSARFEAITLRPLSRIPADASVLPVVRLIVGLAAAIALPLSARAVCWHPARSWMEPTYFTRVALTWLAGGRFPSLGLTAFSLDDRGIAQSCGLSFFTGQEVRIEVRSIDKPNEFEQDIADVIDQLTRTGAVTSSQNVETSAGANLLVEPIDNGRIVLARPLPN